MGLSMSTLGGWAVILVVGGYYGYINFSKKNRPRVASRAGHKNRVEEKQTAQSRKEIKDKPKRQRLDSRTRSNDAEESDKASKTKQRPVRAETTTTHAGHSSSEEEPDNREFARQLASVKQGTPLNGPKKGNEKKTKSIKQSRAREMDKPAESIVSGPSSTAGVDADDDESSLNSPEVKATDAGDVSDMLEPKAAGPSVLRLTDTDKVKQTVKKAKEPEQVETKKQRQNRKKSEAIKALNEENEKARKVALEAQRRLARISEGRPAQDGSASAAQQKPVWTGNGINGNVNGASLPNGNFMPVQPLDTFDFSAAGEPQKKAATESSTEAPKSTAPGVPNSWMSDLPSEEEQMMMLMKEKEEEAWSTVKTKKAKSKTKTTASESADESASGVTNPQQLTPVVNAPVVTAAQKSSTVNGRPTKAFSQQSSFAALSTNDGPEEVEQEWDV